jgi:uncharacterized protein with HEPN domain
VKDERTRLLHAIDAVDAIQRYTVECREAFFSDDKTQDAVIRNIRFTRAVRDADARCASSHAR